MRFYRKADPLFINSLRALLLNREPVRHYRTRDLCL
uniref:Uncharacterized protein n=1 Tax=Anguilla anguilla TaxID=7936 RepID=A0A0E9UDZ6_ANGAN